MAGSLAVGGPSERADVFVKAMTTRQWIQETERYPEAPKDVAELYETHLAMQQHELAAQLGGHGGYKLGAAGALGETCLYAPLFSSFFADAPARELSSASYQVHQVEPEFGMVLGSDLPARADGAPHSVEDVWSAVERVVLCIECCGRRASAELTAAQTPLGKFADSLMAGAVVRGPSLPTSGLDVAGLAGCATRLAVNGTQVSEGSGAAVPDGGPVQALTWLANHLNGRGLSLQKGQLVITGATCITRDIQIGDKVSASFVGLGDLEFVLEP